MRIVGLKNDKNQRVINARCLVPKMVKNGYKSVFAYLSP